MRYKIGAGSEIRTSYIDRNMKYILEMMLSSLSKYLLFSC